MKEFTAYLKRMCMVIMLKRQFQLQRLSKYKQHKPTEKEGLEVLEIQTFVSFSILKDRLL